MTSPPLVRRRRRRRRRAGADNLRVDAPAGVVRAFDARTGALRWAWDPVPPGCAAAARTAATRRGTPNAWSLPLGGRRARPRLRADGQPVARLYGGAAPRPRPLLELGRRARAATGRGAPGTSRPCTTTSGTTTCPRSRRCSSSERRRRPAPALAQITKMGHLFLLDRETGAPLYPGRGAARAAGRRCRARRSRRRSPSRRTRAPLHPGGARARRRRSASRRWDRAKCRETLAALRNEGIFTPPEPRGLDRRTRATRAGRTGAASRSTPCAAVALREPDARADVAKLVPRAEYDALDYDERAPTRTSSTRWRARRTRRARGPLLSPLRRAVQAAAVGHAPAPSTSRAARCCWEVRARHDARPGAVPDLARRSARRTSAARSRRRAGSSSSAPRPTSSSARSTPTTGAEIWRARLPYTANATPITYRLRPDGRQFVVVAAGGHGWSEPGDALLAFALPERGAAAR